MSIIEPRLNANTTSRVQNEIRENVRTRKMRSPWARFSRMSIRRSRLYFGLLLVPWAVLDGLTPYLFNHPPHYSTTSTIRFLQQIFEVNVLWAILVDFMAFALVFWGVTALCCGGKSKQLNQPDLLDSPPIMTLSFNRKDSCTSFDQKDFRK